MKKFFKEKITGPLSRTFNRESRRNRSINERDAIGTSRNHISRDIPLSSRNNENNGASVSQLPDKDKEKKLENLKRSEDSGSKVFDVSKSPANNGINGHMNLDHRMILMEKVLKNSMMVNSKSHDIVVEQVEGERELYEVSERELYETIQTAAEKNRQVTEHINLNTRMEIENDIPELRESKKFKDLLICYEQHSSDLVDTRRYHGMDKLKGTLTTEGLSDRYKGLQNN